MSAASTAKLLTPLVIRLIKEATADSPLKQQTNITGRGTDRTRGWDFFTILGKCFASP